MRSVLLVASMAVLVSCGTSPAKEDPPAASSSPGRADAASAPVRAAAPAPAPAPGSVDAERAANELAYRFVYLPLQKRITASSRGSWLAIVAGQLLPAIGAEPGPVATFAEADAAARAAVPNARHRFLFRIGEEGDVDLDLGGCELPHVLGVQFLALLERDDVVMKGLGPGERIEVRLGDSLKEITVKTPDELRMYLRPVVGAPDSPGAERENYCLSTGFTGHATMSSAAAAGLELWEIPGVAHVKGAMQSGDCRRAHARFSWPNTPLDFTVPVAIWPK